MRSRSHVVLLASLGAALAGASAGAQQKAAAPRATAVCDRGCLNALVDSYFAALVAHDPKKVRIAENARFVENITPMKPGEGLWKSASAVPTTFKIYVPDPVSQQVGFLGVMQESGKPVEVAVRLKLENGEIIEMEHLVARGLGERNLPNLQTPRAAFTTAVPAAQRNTRGQMLKIGASYYDALDDNDGSKAPFADDCVRRENGMQTTGNPPPATPGGIASTGALGCKAQLDTGTFQYIDKIDDRRVTMADPESGLVMGLSHFHHSMKQKYVTIKGVPGVDKIDMPFDAFDLPAAHVFKVSGGKIHEIEAMGFRADYQSPTGWETHAGH
jgi:hypothetical protein